MAVSPERLSLANQKNMFTVFIFVLFLYSIYTTHTILSQNLIHHPLPEKKHTKKPNAGNQKKHTKKKQHLYQPRKPKKLMFGGPVLFDNYEVTRRSQEPSPEVSEWLRMLGPWRGPTCSPHEKRKNVKEFYGCFQK